MKSYIELIEQISADQLYEGLLAFGLFSERTLPIFTGKYFWDYCVKNTPTFSALPKNGSGYMSYKNMRNINIPRELGIPNPMAYHKLCECLKNNWDNIKTHFKQYTLGQIYKVSRIHIRKKSGTKRIFSMNYSNWELDGEPEAKLLLGKRFLVHADISNCFPSMYSHSLTWALAGREIAKLNRSGNWYNDVDSATQKLKNGETHGFLIGPHASNLLSEIILVVVDKVLIDRGYNFIRHIDDYSCYTKTYEEAQDFITDLSDALHGFDLLLNYKKVAIEELPIAIIEKWKRQLNTSMVLKKNNYLDYNATRAFLDSAIELMRNNDDNAAILRYAIKTLKNRKLSRNAQIYAFETITQYAYLYPYLIPLLDDYVFRPYKIKKDDIEPVIDLLYNEGLKRKNYEAISYSLYFAIKYQFSIKNLTPEMAIDSKDAFFNLLAFKYFSQKKDASAVKKIKSYARSIKYSTEDYDRNWLFIYETLPESDLKGDWRTLKKAKVKFVTI